MPWNNNIMTAPINTNIGGDIQKALNTRYNGDLGETYKRAFDNNRVKKWSWHKPVRHPSMGYDMRNLPAGDDGFNGQQPVGMFCIGSLEMPYSQSLGTVSTDGTGKIHTVDATGFLGKLMRGQIAWNYRYPRGVDAPNNINEPYRLFDMVGYYGEATCPLPTPPSGERTISSAGAITFVVGIPTITHAENMSLSTMHTPGGLVAAMPALETFYVGLLLYKENYSDCFWKTAEYPLNYDSVENKERKVSFLTIADKVGTWNVRTFISSAQLGYCENPQVAPSPGGFLMFIGGADEVGTLTLSVYDDPSDIPEAVPLAAKWISAVGDTTPTQIRATVTIVNRSQIADATLSNVKMEVIQGLFDDVVATHNFPTPTSLNRATAQSYAYLFAGLEYDEITKVKFYCTMTLPGDTPQIFDQEVELT